MADELIMLGTGSAFPSASYHTCFALRNESGILLVDTGGGNGILTSLRNAGINCSQIHDLFITHVHTDHILGAVWLIRSIINSARENRYDGKVNIYGNSEVLSAVDTICRITLLKNHYELYKALVNPVEVDDNTDTISGNRVRFFNVGSKNVMQTGFRMTMRRGKDFTFLGDESLTDENAEYVSGTDILMCGAFCRYADREIYKPYEKHHHTVKDVAELAEKYAVSTLVLVHCEDNNLAKREILYSEEASKYYNGRLIVPVDGQIISI